VLFVIPVFVKAKKERPTQRTHSHAGSWWRQSPPRGRNNGNVFIILVSNHASDRQTDRQTAKKERKKERKKEVNEDGLLIWPHSGGTATRTSVILYCFVVFCFFGLYRSTKGPGRSNEGVVYLSFRFVVFEFLLLHTTIMKIVPNAGFHYSDSIVVVVCL